MDENERESLYRLSAEVVGAAYEVANVLGSGFLEKVYERALLRELKSRGFQAEAQVPVPVAYKGEVVGEYFVGILVEDKLIVELKCVERFTNEHLAQCINYLKATGHTLALLINFQRPRLEWKRVVRHF